MIWPRWLAKWLAHIGGYFWLKCPNCHRYFAGFESGRYSVGMDAHGRFFRMALGHMLTVTMAAEDPTRVDVPRHWWGCCKRCDMWLPVLWKPMPKPFDKEINP